MRALERAGNRPGALKHAAVHEALVRGQLGISPDPAVVSLADPLKRLPVVAVKQARVEQTPATPRQPLDESLLSVDRPVPTASDPSVASESVAAHEPALPSRTSTARRLSIVGASAIAAVAVAALVWSTAGSAPDTSSRTASSGIAVLPFADHGDSASSYLREGCVRCAGRDHHADRGHDAKGDEGN